MDIKILIKDLESQGFKGNLQKDGKAEYFAFGIALNDGEIPIYLLAKIIDGVVYISTVEMITDATISDLPYFMGLNDLIVTGKLFMSTDINELKKTGPKTPITIDYGFEILEDYYSNEMLSAYIERMFKNLEDLVFSR